MVGLVVRVKALFLDIDGTLTIDRSSYRFSLEAIAALRRVVDSGVIVSLVSSNALPIVVGLSRYIGLNGPVIGETGSLVYYDEWGLVGLATKSAREPYEALLREYGVFLEDSWQNRFRVFEYVLKLKREYVGGARSILVELRRFIESRYPGFTVDYSGYALHVRQVDVDKKRAVLYILGRLGIDPAEAGGVGDSYMDSSFLSVLGYSAAVANADDELKECVRFVLSKPSGLGVVEFIDYILGG
jgi:phosphoglycolate phosphatase (TIGR01487 family)